MDLLVAVQQVIRVVWLLRLWRVCWEVVHTLFLDQSFYAVCLKLVGKTSDFGEGPRNLLRLNGKFGWKTWALPTTRTNNLLIETPLSWWYFVIYLCVQQCFPFKHIVEEHFKRSGSLRLHKGTFSSLIVWVLAIRSM